MNRLLLLLLVTEFGFGSVSVKADPIAPNTTGNLIDSKSEKPISSSQKVKDKSINNANKLVPSPYPKTKDDSLQIKTYKHNYHPGKFTPRVGDFGPLPTNSYKPKSHSEDAVPPHPSDFGAVPIESGPDTRRAK